MRVYCLSCGIGVECTVEILRRGLKSNSAQSHIILLCKTEITPADPDSLGYMCAATAAFMCGGTLVDVIAALQYQARILYYTFLDESV